VLRHSSVSDSRYMRQEPVMKEGRKRFFRTHPLYESVFRANDRQSEDMFPGICADFPALMEAKMQALGRSLKATGKNSAAAPDSPCRCFPGKMCRRATFPN